MILNDHILDVAPDELAGVVRTLATYSNRDEAQEQMLVWILAVLDQLGYGEAAQLYREWDE